MAQSVESPGISDVGGAPRMKRSVGFFGLTFVSLGSIIGSGWLLGALSAAETAGGGGSLVSWVLAAIMLIVLALIHADLGAAYPVSGGTARYPHYAFGGFAGFTAGWTTYLQAVAIAPLEVEASLGYVNSVGSIKENFALVNVDGTLTFRGIIIGVLAMLLFMFINLGGAKLMSDSNTGIVIWKIAVPLLTVVVLLILTFHPGNFTHGGFAPFGFKGIFAALPVGVVFALQGFEQATQMAGEAKNPKKDVSRAIITAMIIGAVLYILLEIAFVGGLNPAKIGNWQSPIGSGDYGPYYTLAITAGVGWLAVILIIDAVISPGGTGLIYVGTTARISYALGLPKSLSRLSIRGVPVWSIVVATVFGMIALAPAPSWQQLVSLITGATAIMYAFAPVSLGALMKGDVRREHPYRLPYPKVLLPVGFAFANLIIYWGKWQATWQLAIGLLIGQLIFVIAALVNANAVDVPRARWKSALWIWPWFLGLCVLGKLGNFGTDGKGATFWNHPLHVIPNEIDALVVIAWSIVIYYWAVRMVQSTELIEEIVAQDAVEDEFGDQAAKPALA